MFLTHVGPIFGPKTPIFKAFWDFQRTKMDLHKLKTVQNNFFLASDMV